MSYDWKFPFITPTTQIYILALTVALICTLTSTSKADLRVLKKEPDDIELLISGAITDSDAEAFESLEPQLDRSFLVVRLDSIGGDVDAAIRIGQLIRKAWGVTTIQKENSDDNNANCYGSCALVFIAGVDRLLIADGGQLGLHRPYLVSAPQSQQILEKQVPLMYSRVKQYIADMGISDNFYQQMMNAEPSTMIVYGATRISRTDSDKKVLREMGIRTPTNEWTTLLPKRDPLYDEIMAASQARRYGVTTAEMRKREEDAAPCYKNRDSDCLQAIRWGLSERVYIERDKLARASCAMRGEDKALLRSLPNRERLDHPAVIKQQTCIRDIMLGRN